ncbi:biotin transporter BioY [Weissella confusa]|uniref:Biotin transporter BioY n=1 Tax=Weissella confusa TaxID=1583 RepID=A0A923NF78_WEICO|nr:biotin transporter BioY [Weissella confusa]
MKFNKKTEMTSGVGIVIGPTGGYLIGMLLFPLVIGMGASLSRSWPAMLLWNLIAAFLQLGFGTLWLAFVAKMAIALVLAAVFAAIIAILAPLSIPTGIVPLTVQTIIIPLIASIAATRVSFSAVAVYLLLGMIGMPVYAGFLLPTFTGNWPAG